MWGRVQGSRGGARTGVCAEGLEGGRQKQRWRGHPVSALTLGGAIPWEGEEGGTAWWQEKALVWGYSVSLRMPVGPGGEEASAELRAGLS